MGAINASNGRFITEFKEEYFNQYDTIEFIDDLIRANGGTEKVCLFFDNSSIHVGKEVMQYIKQYKVKVIRNIPYEPEFNGIEVCFSLEL